MARFDCYMARLVVVKCHLYLFTCVKPLQRYMRASEMLMDLKMCMPINHKIPD